jgi:GT2 family glycosyltransferase
MTIGVVVVAYRDAEALRDCLASVSGFEHVVVVNVTHDASVSEVVVACGRTELPLEDNTGYGGGVNAGVAHLDPSADSVLFMNDDVLLLNPPSGSPNGVAVPGHRDSGGNAMSVLHSLPTPVAFVREWILSMSVKTPAPGEPVPKGAFANAAAAVASRAVLEKFPLPTEYFLYWEEAAWFWRLADAGVPVVMDRAVVQRPRGDREFSETKATLMGYNLIRLADERYGVAGRALYAGLGLLWVVRLIVTDGARSDRRQRWAMRRRTGAALIAACFALGSSREAAT